AAVNTDGAVYAFNAADGSTLWQNDKLKYRDLSAPLALGRVVVVGDKQGYLHFLSRDNGEFLARVKLSGAISAQPVIAGQTLVVQTRDG
ncbi:outer membrane protein assembly factor BamB family protein, partial [Pandoraea pneumonica]